MVKTQKSKSFSLVICLLVYIIATLTAWSSTKYFESDYSLLVVTLIADVVATVVVFIFSVIFKNSSLYDPYWSVAPPVVIWHWIYKVQEDVSPAGLLILCVTVFWSLRLTLNWIRGWSGLNHEDWRYIKLRNENPAIYPFINFAGIHLFPTLMVFICLIPAYYSLIENKGNLNLMVFAAAVICVAATVISLIADEQMREFRKSSGRVDSMESGLWKYSRHPNYLGEILFWFGIWLIAIALNIQLYWTSFGFVTLTLMFIFISIPMMEQRNLASRKSYADVMKRVPMLIRLF